MPHTFWCALTGAIEVRLRLQMVRSGVIILFFQCSISCHLSLSLDTTAIAYFAHRNFKRRNHFPRPFTMSWECYNINTDGSTVEILKSLRKIIAKDTFSTYLLCFCLSFVRCPLLWSKRPNINTRFITLAIVSWEIKMLVDQAENEKNTRPYSHRVLNWWLSKR